MTCGGKVAAKMRSQLGRRFWSLMWQSFSQNEESVGTPCGGKFAAKMRSQLLTLPRLYSSLSIWRDDGLLVNDISEVAFLIHFRFSKKMDEVAFRWQYLN